LKSNKVLPRSHVNAPMPPVKPPRQPRYMPDWSDDKVAREVLLDTYLNKARKEFKAARRRITEVLSAEGDPPSPIEMRRMEFDAVVRIAEALGVKLL